MFIAVVTKSPKGITTGRCLLFVFVRWLAFHRYICSHSFHWSDVKRKGGGGRENEKKKREICFISLIWKKKIKEYRAANKQRRLDAFSVMYHGKFSLHITDGEETAEGEYKPEVDFKPIVSLPEVETKTGDLCTYINDCSSCLPLHRWTWFFYKFSCTTK